MPIPPTNKTLHFINLAPLPIFEQLQLEEALLRSEDRNFCLVNIGSPRAIVMGISGNPTALLDLERVKTNKVPVYQRFSGGGTVVIDEATLFITFIFSKDTLAIPAFPEPILRWTAELYARAWNIPHFKLQENDYVIQDKKCGGNAQYIKKERWLHHTSFLWDFKKENMDFLLLPPKRPQYRANRPHTEFLCRLKEQGASPEQRIAALREELVKQFYIQEFDLRSLREKPHRKALKEIIF